MVQAAFSMLVFWTLGLACLFFCCTTDHESSLGTNAASVNRSSRKTCLKTGEEAFNPAAPTCCRVEQGDTITEPYDPDKQMCCGPIGSKKILTRESSHQRCCGQNQFNPTTHCCCETNDTLHIELINSSCCVNNSALCEGKTFDPDKQMCCGPIGSKKILTMESSHQRCCGQNQFNPTTHRCCETNDTLHIELINSSCCVNKSALCEGKTFDPDKQMCCGPIGSKKILTMESSHQRCCGQNQFNPTTHRCCETNDTLHIELINSSCCVNKSDMQQQKPGPQPNCTEPQTSICGSSCYNLKEFRCCERNQTKCTPGGCDVFPTVYNPHTHVCCDGHVSEWKPRIYQLHGSRGHHCCGTEVYQPDTEICCDGHRHPKDEDTHCCGIYAYHSKNHQKCCAGTLYNLSLLGPFEHEAQCCGSTLQKAKDVCCNSPAHQPGHHQKKMTKESRLESVNNLNETDLCEEMQVGTVEMVFLHCIIFSDVIKIHGRNGSVNHVASTRTLKTPDRCNSPKVFPGKTYSFDEDNVLIDFNHDSILQSIHFIMSKCNRR